MKIVCLLLGSVLSILFIIFMFKGGREDSMLEPLEGEDFPLKFLYSAGLAWQRIPFMRLRGRVSGKLHLETALYYDEKYSEYYSRIIWAQALTFAHLFPAVFLLLAAVMDESMTMFLIAAGAAAGVLSAYYFLTHAGEKVKQMREECEQEFPNAISKLALLVNSGVILHDAWIMAAYGKEGTLYNIMRRACEEMQTYGKSDIDAVYQFGMRTDSQEIKKFTSILIQSMEKGGGDLPSFLAKQSSELWEFKRQQMLQKGEKAAGALLAPVGLMFAGVMLIVLAAAMQSFSM